MRAAADRGQLSPWYCQMHSLICKSETEPFGKEPAAVAEGSRSSAASPSALKPTGWLFFPFFSPVKHIFNFHFFHLYCWAAVQVCGSARLVLSAVGLQRRFQGRWSLLGAVSESTTTAGANVCPASGSIQPPPPDSFPHHLLLYFIK